MEDFDKIKNVIKQYHSPLDIEDEWKALTMKKDKHLLEKKMKSRNIILSIIIALLFCFIGAWVFQNINIYLFRQTVEDKVEINPVLKLKEERNDLLTINSERNLENKINALEDNNNHLGNKELKQKDNLSVVINKEVQEKVNKGAFSEFKNELVKPKLEYNPEKQSNNIEKNKVEENIIAPSIIKAENQQGKQTKTSIIQNIIKAENDQKTESESIEKSATQHIVKAENDQKTESESIEKSVTQHILRTENDQKTESESIEKSATQNIVKAENDQKIESESIEKSATQHIVKEEQINNLLSPKNASSGLTTVNNENDIIAKLQIKNISIIIDTSNVLSIRNNLRKDPPLIKRNKIYRKSYVLFELFGQGAFYSLNYGRTIVNQSIGQTDIRIGISLNPKEINGNETGLFPLLVPLSVNQSFNLRTYHNLSLGLGATLVNDKLINEPNYFYLIGSFKFEYKFQAPSKRVFYKAEILSLHSFEDIFSGSTNRLNISESSFWGGLGIGYTF